MSKNGKALSKNAPPENTKFTNYKNLTNKHSKFGKRAGLPPGTLVHTGQKKLDKMRVRVIDFNSEKLEEKEIEKLEDVFQYKDSPTASWINIDGLHETKKIEALGAHFGVHSLVLEDIVNTRQRAKTEIYYDHIFIVMKMLRAGNADREIAAEQLSLLIGDNYVITFQERVGDVFEPVRERLRTNRIRIRKGGPDYLAYSLIDAVVDNYFFLLDNMEEQLDNLEERLNADPNESVLQELYTMRKKISRVRKAVLPVRELVGALTREESPVMQENTLIYFRDVYDHAVRVSETIDTLRDMLAGMIDAYHTMMSNRMNEVMKVLTIIATIFIPLTFIAGIYGMNFQVMPELSWKYGYFAALVVMLVAAILMVIWFRKKKWL